MRRQILAILVSALVSASLVQAHAVLLAAVPVAHQSLDGPDIDVRLHFNCPIDSAPSRLTLSLPDGNVSPLRFRHANPGVLTSRARGLTAGDYRLRRQVLAADGLIYFGCSSIGREIGASFE